MKRKTTVKRTNAHAQTTLKRWILIDTGAGAGMYSYYYFFFFLYKFRYTLLPAYTMKLWIECDGVCQVIACARAHSPRFLHLCYYSLWVFVYSSTERVISYAGHAHRSIRYAYPQEQNDKKMYVEKEKETERNNRTKICRLQRTFCVRISVVCWHSKRRRATATAKVRKKWLTNL